MHSEADAVKDWVGEPQSGDGPRYQFRSLFDEQGGKGANHLRVQFWIGFSLLRDSMQMSRAMQNPHSVLDTRCDKSDQGSAA